MLRVFIDASVLFAGLYSKTGSARDLLEFALRKRVVTTLNQEIRDEVERNVHKKAPRLESEFRELMKRLNPEIVEQPTEDVLANVATYVVGKDVHVIAAAIAAQPDYLVTYDRKHLLDVPEVAARSGLKIVTPDVVVALINDQA